MADAILRLHVNPVTGRRVLAIDYTSDSDALPYEHEQEHKRIAGKVLEGGLKGSKITVEREGSGGVVNTQTNEAPAPQPVANKGQ